MPSTSGYPSIQSFFKPEARSTTSTQTLPRTPPIIEKPGDGFTASEIEEVKDPLQREFNPVREYTDMNIGELMPGMQHVRLEGRVANFSTLMGRSKKENSARGWHRLILKDDSGAIQVTLFFSRQPYEFHLGMLLTIWTPFIASEFLKESFQIPNAPISTSIFPGRDPSVHMVINLVSESGTRFRIPLNRKDSSQRLVTLKSFLAGADDVPHATLLFCIKSIGPRKELQLKNGNQVILRELKVFDDTAEANFKLWNEMTLSTADWIPGVTLLMVSNPGFRSDFGKGCIGVTHATMVDVNPECEDAKWLSNFLLALKKGESVCQDLPRALLEEWDLKTIVGGSQRVLFTLADIDEQARANPEGKFFGYLSLVILDMNLSLYHRRNMLMCNECCGHSLYTNSLTTRCKTCETDLNLFPNPKIIDTLSDSTGSISGGKLIWTSKAWEMLFDSSISDLVGFQSSRIREVEQLLLGVRVTVVFGWAGTVGRIAVLGIGEG